MGKEVKIGCVQREFGHCVINWEVINYGFAAHGMQYELKSEEFTVRPHMTSWRIIMKSQLGLCEDTKIPFYLERMYTDSGPCTVWVNIDVSISNQDGKIWKGFRAEQHFRRSERKLIYLPNIYFGKVNVGLYNFNTMTLRCQMIVKEENHLCRSDNLIGFGLRGFSLDMEQLFTCFKFKDVTLKLENDFQTAAHKAILSARSTGLNEEFNGHAFPVFNCPNLRYNETCEVLRYLYTGDVTHVIEKPSLHAYDCINAFSIDELGDHFVADEHNLKSTIDVHQAGLLWTIENFCERNEECIVSHVISGDLVEMAWVLKLYPRGISGEDDYLTIIAENVEEKIDGKMWAKVEIFHDPSDRYWKTMRVLKMGEIFGLQHLDTRESVLEKLVDGALKICFKVCVSTGESHLSDSQINPSPYVPYENYYRKLSEDIYSLRFDTRYADLLLTVQGKEFNCHKCILSARSSKFSNLSDDLNEDKIVHIEDIKPDIVEIVLDYVYSGVSQMFKWDILLEVYEAAEKLGVNYLVQEYSQILCNNVNVSNVHQILMCAIEHIDEPLLKEALRFLKLDASICDKFLVLEEESSTLSTEVETALEKLHLNSL